MAVPASSQPYGYETKALKVRAEGEDSTLTDGFDYFGGVVAVEKEKKGKKGQAATTPAGAGISGRRRRADAAPGSVGGTGDGGVRMIRPRNDAGAPAAPAAAADRSGVASPADIVGGGVLLTAERRPFDVTPAAASRCFGDRDGAVAVLTEAYRPLGGFAPRRESFGPAAAMAAARFPTVPAAAGSGAVSFDPATSSEFYVSARPPLRRRAVVLILRMLNVDAVADYCITTGRRRE